MTLSRPLLPDGYHMERDADVLTMLGADGSLVARFSAHGVEWHEVERPPDDRRFTAVPLEALPLAPP